jgi:sulfur carrier protein
VTTTITVNGEPVEFSGSLVDLVAARYGDPDRGGLAIAVDHAVVPRSAWPTCVLAAGARVEIVTAVQGG